MSLTTFPPKGTSEAVLLPFDFLSRLPAGASLSSTSATSSLWSGPVGAASLTVGSPTITGSVGQVLVAGGTDGAIYLVTMTAITSDGQTLPMSGLVAVVAQPC